MKPIQALAPFFGLLSLTLASCQTASQRNQASVEALLLFEAADAKMEALSELPEDEVLHLDPVTFARTR